MELHSGQTETGQQAAAGVKPIQLLDVGRNSSVPGLVVPRDDYYRVSFWFGLADFKYDKKEKLSIHVSFDGQEKKTRAIRATRAAGLLSVRRFRRYFEAVGFSCRLKQGQHVWKVPGLRVYVWSETRQEVVAQASADLRHGEKYWWENSIDDDSSVEQWSVVGFGPMGEASLCIKLTPSTPPTLQGKYSQERMVYFTSRARRDDPVVLEVINLANGDLIQRPSGESWDIPLLPSRYQFRVVHKEFIITPDETYYPEDAALLNDAKKKKADKKEANRKAKIVKTHESAASVGKRVENVYDSGTEYWQPMTRSFGLVDNSKAVGISSSENPYVNNRSFLDLGWKVLPLEAFFVMEVTESESTRPRYMLERAKDKLVLNGFEATPVQVRVSLTMGFLPGLVLLVLGLSFMAVPVSRTAALQCTLVSVCSMTSHEKMAAYLVQANGGRYENVFGVITNVTSSSPGNTFQCWASLSDLERHPANLHIVPILSEEPDDTDNAGLFITGIYLAIAGGSLMLVACVIWLYRYSQQTNRVHRMRYQFVTDLRASLSTWLLWFAAIGAIGLLGLCVTGIVMGGTLLGEIAFEEYTEASECSDTNLDTNLCRVDLQFSHERVSETTCVYVDQCDGTLKHVSGCYYQQAGDDRAVEFFVIPSAIRAQRISTDQTIGGVLLGVSIAAYVLPWAVMWIYTTFIRDRLTTPADTTARPPLIDRIHSLGVDENMWDSLRHAYA